MILVSPEVAAKRETFFRYIYGTNKGYICLSRRDISTEEWHDQFFQYPDDLESFLHAIEAFSQNHDLYYCPHLFSQRMRQKAYVTVTPSAWADLDACPPSNLLVEPTLTIESSPGRYQAIWMLDQKVDPTEAEDLSKRIAVYHKNDGIDNCWNLTRALRVPFTYNFKYKGLGGPPVVNILATNPAKLTLDTFREYPELDDTETEKLLIPFPNALPDDTAEDLLGKYHTHLHPHVWLLYQQVPREDWSKRLWQLEMLLFESGLSREEVFIIARSAACNKYERDGRSERFLWKEVCKAEQRQRSEVVPVKKVEDVPLLSDEERTWAMNHHTLVEEYVEWGRGLGDAAWQYHQAGAFVALSTLLAGGVKLPTSFGVVVPNLWFMILADTTLTRKTTAMDLAVDVLLEIDKDCVLATDGSIEGLFSSLSMRPGRPSIFLRDEFSGLLDAMVRKEYLAGMAETFTKMYDGKFQKRVLRREIIEVRDPILIMFTGGIRTRVLDLLSREHVASGFLPRFIFITAESNVSALRPLGPPSTYSTGMRERLVTEFARLHVHYNGNTKVTLGGVTRDVPKKWDAALTPEAWARYNRFENAMVDAGLNMRDRDLYTPTYDRLAKSGLKCAVLLAASRQREDRLIVEETDIVKAIWFVEQWREYTRDVVRNIGKSNSEKLLDAVLSTIRKAGEAGIRRSELMRNHHLNAREADIMFTTLEQRDLITRKKTGARSEILYPIGSW